MSDWVLDDDTPLARDAARRAKEAAEKRDRKPAVRASVADVKFRAGILDGIKQLGGVTEYWLGFATSADPKERLAALKAAMQAGILDDAMGETGGDTTIVINTLTVMAAKPPREFFGDDAKTPDVLDRIKGSFVTTTEGVIDVPVVDDFDPESIL